MPQLVTAEGLCHAIGLADVSRVKFDRQPHAAPGGVYLADEAPARTVWALTPQGDFLMARVDSKPLTDFARRWLPKRPANVLPLLTDALDRAYAGSNATTANESRLGTGAAAEVANVSTPSPTPMSGSEGDSEGQEAPGQEEQQAVHPAIAALKQHFAGVDGHVQVEAIHPEMGVIETKCAPINDLEKLEAFIRRREGSWNLYFVPNPVKPGLSKKASKVDVKSIGYLHVDVDPSADHPLEEERQRIEQALDAFPIKPNVLIDSGGGFQCFWRLATALHPTSENIAKVEAINKAIGHHLEGDSCHTVEHLMRLPCTMNWPDAKKQANGRVPAPAVIVHQDGGLYSLEDFGLLFEAQAHEARAEPGPSVDVHSLHTSSEMKRRIREGVGGRDAPDTHAEGEVDTSGPEFGAVRAMVKGGHSDLEIMSVMMDEANRLFERCRKKGRAWCEGEIKRAREKPDEAGVDGAVSGPSLKSASGSPLDRLVNAAALAKMKLPEPRWIIPDLLPEGLTLFAGKSKAGKSWWVLQLAFRVATDQGDVLYLALEDTARRAQGRILLVSGAEPVPASLELATQSDWPRLDLGGEAYIRQWLEAHPGARLVIVDTLAKVKPHGKRNGNAYDEDYVALAGLKRLADEFGVAILVVHHLRKMPDADDPLSEISGTTGLVGCADTIMVLKRARGSNSAQLFVTGRDVEERWVPMTWDPDTCRWSMDTAEQSEQQDTMSEGRRTIIDLIAKLGPMTMHEIVNASAALEGTVKSRLSRMVSDRLLINRDGRYCLNETTATGKPD